MPPNPKLVALRDTYQTLVDVGEQVYARLLIRVSQVRASHGPLLLPRFAGTVRAYINFSGG